MLAHNDATLLLMAYLLYARSTGQTSLGRGLRLALETLPRTPLWEKLYRAVLQDADVFKRVSNDGGVAVSARPIRRSMLGPGGYEPAMDNYLFHNFADVEEAVRAYAATGWLIYSGYRILPDRRGFTSGSGDAVALPKSFCDGGRPVVWGRASHCLYYHTFFSSPHKSSDMMFCTADSVERLFMQGVEDALALLAGNASPRMCLVAPEDDLDSAGDQFGQKSGFLRKGAFVDVCQRCVSTVDEVCTRNMRVLVDHTI